jgi:catechol 2,3-dioxygenase-like lactoylglutathione lyase family enzyme
VARGPDAVGRRRADRAARPPGADRRRRRADGRLLHLGAGHDGETFGGGRRALHFGQQKINLHQAGREFEPKASRPTPGSADLCFVTTTPVEEVAAHLAAQGVAVEEGPVERTGALGPMRSVYLRDPDGNLLEISAY